MTTQTDLINDIPEGKPVRIFLPLLETNKRHREQCVFQKTTAPRFNLLFKPGTLPVSTIDTLTPCIISLDMAGRNVSVEAMIQQVENEQTLAMIARKAINHEQLREYFRVDYTLPMIVTSRIPEGFSPPEEYWKLFGTIIDISGGGLLAIFHHKPPDDKLVKIQLPLPDNPTVPVSFLASPVRVSEVEKNRYVVAYQYEEIDDDYRDRIISQCLITQRHQLRLKVQILKGNE